MSVYMSTVSYTYPNTHTHTHIIFYLSIFTYKLPLFLLYCEGVGSLFLGQGLISCPLHWEHGLNHWAIREVPVLFLTKTSVMLAYDWVNVVKM